MDESEGNISTEDVNNIDSPTFVKIKPKKRSLVERELETNLTARVTSPVTSEGSSTSRYGRARKLKTTADFDMEKMSSQIMKPLKIDVSKQPQAYKMHASNSPISKESPKRTISMGSSIEDQIENIYNENISLSRFGSEEKIKSPSKKFNKIYIRKDLIQKPDTDSVVLIKNMFSPNKPTSHLNNILERSSEKYSLNGHGKAFNNFPDTSSVVKTLDFDGKKKNKSAATGAQPIKKEVKEKAVAKNELFELEAGCEYQVGDLAWARVGTYPYWPCIVTRDPFSDMFVKKKLFGRVERSVIHVTFFGDNGRRGWIVDNMLRKYQGRAEFEACREKFTPESKKKDPRLYAAHFVSDKKLSLWNVSVNEAETLMKEPKRLRIDALYDMLERARAAKTTPSKREKSGKITRTDSDVSLSESLYDTLFSEDDGKTDDSNRLKKARNKSLDVSEVVTACLDNMAAKSGIIQIQRQSHMDRWLQKAKSKTPEKMQPKLHIKVDREKMKDNIKKKKEGKKTQKVRKNEALGSDANLLPYQNEHDYSSVNYENHNINDSSNKNTELASGLDSTLDTSTTMSDIGVTVKIENISSNMEDCSQDDIITSIVNDDIVMTDPENIRRDDDSQNVTHAHNNKKVQNNNEHNLVTTKKDDNEVVEIKEELPLNTSDLTNIFQPRRSKRKRQTFEGLNNSITENKAKEPKLDLSGQKPNLDTATPSDIPESNKNQENTLETEKDSEKTVLESKIPTIKSIGKETSRNGKFESTELVTFNSNGKPPVLIELHNSENTATAINAPTVANFENRKSQKKKRESTELISFISKSKPVVAIEPNTSENTSIDNNAPTNANLGKNQYQNREHESANLILSSIESKPEVVIESLNSENTAIETTAPTVANLEKQTLRKSQRKSTELMKSKPVVVIDPNTLIDSNAPTNTNLDKDKSENKKQESAKLFLSNNDSKSLVVIEPLNSENTAKEITAPTVANVEKQTHRKSQRKSTELMKSKPVVVIEPNTSENTSIDSNAPTNTNLDKSENKKQESAKLLLSKNDSKSLVVIEPLNSENTAIEITAPTVATVEKQTHRKSQRKSTELMKSKPVVVIEPNTSENTSIDSNAPTNTNSDKSENKKQESAKLLLSKNDSKSLVVIEPLNSENTAIEITAPTVATVEKQTHRKSQRKSTELMKSKPVVVSEPNTSIGSIAPVNTNLEKDKSQNKKHESAKLLLSNNGTEPVVVIEPLNSENTAIKITAPTVADVEKQTHRKSQRKSTELMKSKPVVIEPNTSENTSIDSNAPTNTNLDKDKSENRKQESAKLLLSKNDSSKSLVVIEPTEITAPTVANVEKQTHRKSQRKSTELMKSKPVVVIDPNTLIDSNAPTNTNLDKDKSENKKQESAKLFLSNNDSKSLVVIEPLNSENTAKEITAPTVANVEKQTHRKSQRKSTELMKSKPVVVIEPNTSENTSIDSNAPTNTNLDKSKNKKQESAKLLLSKNDSKSLVVIEPLNSENTAIAITAPTVATVEKQTHGKSQRKSTELMKSKPIVVNEPNTSENTSIYSNAPTNTNLEKDKSQNKKHGAAKLLLSNNGAEPVVVIEPLNSENTAIDITAPTVANVEKLTHRKSQRKSTELMKSKPVVVMEPNTSENTLIDSKAPTNTNLDKESENKKQESAKLLLSNNDSKSLVVIEPIEITPPTVANVEKQTHRKSQRKSTELMKSKPVVVIEPNTSENSSIDSNAPTNTNLEKDMSENKKQESAKLLLSNNDSKSLVVMEPLNSENTAIEITAPTVANVEKQTHRKSQRKSTELTAINSKSKPVVVLQSLHSKSTLSESNEPTILEKEKSQNNEFQSMELTPFNSKTKSVDIIERLNSENTSTERNIPAVTNLVRETSQSSKPESIELMQFNSSCKPVVVIEPLDIKGFETQLVIKGAKQLIKSKILDSVTKNDDSVDKSEPLIESSLVDQLDVNDVLEDAKNTAKESSTVNDSLEKINDKSNAKIDTPGQYHGVVPKHTQGNISEDHHQKAEVVLINHEKMKVDDRASPNVEDQQANATHIIAQAEISETDLTIPMETKLTETKEDFVDSKRMEVDGCVCSDVEGEKANTPHLTPLIEISETTPNCSVTIETKSTKAPKQQDNNEIPKNNILTNVVIGEETYIFDRTLSQDYDEIDGDNYDEYSHLPPVIINKDAADAYVVHNKSNNHEENLPHNGNKASDSMSTEKVSCLDNDFSSKDNRGSCIFLDKGSLQTNLETAKLEDNKISSVIRDVCNTISDEKNEAPNQVTEENNDKCIFLDQSLKTENVQLAESIEKKRKSPRLSLNKTRNHFLKLNNAEKIVQPSDNCIKKVNTDPEKSILETSSLLSNGIVIPVNIDSSLSQEKLNCKKSKHDPEFIKYLEIRQDALLDEQPDLTQDEIVTYLYQNWLYEEGNKSEMKKIDDSEQFNLVKGINQELPHPKKIKKKPKVENAPKKNNVDIRDMLYKKKTNTVLDEEKSTSETFKNPPEHDNGPCRGVNQVQTSQQNNVQILGSSCENADAILEKCFVDTAEISSNLNNSLISVTRRSERAKEKHDTNKTIKELKQKTDDNCGQETVSISSKNSKLSIARRSRRSKDKRDPKQPENTEPENCVLETAPISLNDSEISVTNCTGRPKEKHNTKKAMNEPEFIKYLEMHQDTLLDEQPDLTQDEIVTYLYQNWLYEESNKSEMKKLDDNEQSYLVKGFIQESTLQAKKIKKKSKVDKNEDIRNMLHKENLNDILEKCAPCERIVNGTHEFKDTRIINIGDSKLPGTEESNSLKEHNTIDRVRDTGDNFKTLTETNDEESSTTKTLSDKHPESSNKESETFKKTDDIEDMEFDIGELKVKSASKESAHSKIIKGFIEFEENSSKSKVNEVFDPETASIKSEESGASITTRKGRKEKDAKKSMDNPDFIKYLEARQDTLIDEQPDLTQEEIVTYLYQTWFYEESTKSDVKKSDENEQSNLVKGLNQEPLPQPIKIKKKPKAEKDVMEKASKNVNHKDTKVAKSEKALKNADIRDMIQKPKRKATQSKPYYNEDDSDLEEEDLETFKIFDRDEQNEGGEEIDEVELYFEQLTKPKPNVFKGYVRERVCEICYRAGNLIKCKSCHGTFHMECVKKETEVTEVTGPNRGRKKKRGRKPKGYDPSLDNGSQSDERSQDANNSEELNISIEDEAESHIVVDETNFETLWENKMKELQSNNQEDYISDQEIDWQVEPGHCEIVDLKQKEKPIDLSDYKCNKCLKYDTPVCFVCKSKKSPKSQTEVRQKCQVAHCHRYYHLECLDHWPQTQFNSWELSKTNKKEIEYIEALSCPRHVCHTCVSDDPRGCKTRFCGDKLARCVKCPATYHSYTRCLPAGSQILTGSQIICPRHYEHRPGKVPCHVNTGWCFICALGGTLICCEYCPTSFHAECLNIKPPEGSYMCEDCETGRLPLYGEMVWVKLGHYRWWPGIVLHPTEIPDNILAVKHSDGEFVVRFFGQYDHYWVNRGRVFPFQEGDSGKISSQKSKIDAAFTTAMEHAQRACEILKKMEPNEEEDLEIASSLLPPHYVKLKVNKPAGNVVRRDVDANSLTQCDCDPNQTDPCGPYSHCLNRMLLTECGPLCRAGERCNNRAFEKRLYPRLQAYRTPHRGWGLRTLEHIRQGQFVIEYVGELIDMEEFRRRMCRKHEIRDENFYFLTLDKERMIDAGPKGNLARFMNHCCEPNCETQKWTVLGDVRVGLFALRDIPANSEVTFNYNLECAGIEKKRCLCGAKRCSGYIGAKPKQLQEEKTNKAKPPAKRTYKKRKHVAEPTTSKPKIPNIKIKPLKPRELTEIEKDLLIIKSATNGMSSDSEGSRLSRRSSVEDKNPKALKRKRVSFSTDEFSGKKAKMADSDLPEAV